jgi:hypothetical protein
MRRSTPILLSVTILLIVSLACAWTGVPAPTQDISSLGTAVMETMVSASTQTAMAGFPIGLVDTATAFPTITPELPISSPTGTLSPTPVFTPTPLIPLISVSVATNCRVGPGKVYDRVGALLVGQVAEVVGRNDNGNYWYIRNPNQSNGLCWLWGEYATVTGNFAALPVYTPPPTPTPVPNFEAAYDGIETCTGWWVDIELTNTGGIAFESLSITVGDTTNEQVFSTFVDKFTDLNGCLDVSSKDVLNPGATRTVSAPPFPYDPRGHRLRAILTLCSRDGLNGTCVSREIAFTP